MRKIKVISNYGKKETYLTIDENGVATKKAYENAGKRCGLIAGDCFRLLDTYDTSAGRVAIHIVVKDGDKIIAIID